MQDDDGCFKIFLVIALLGLILFVTAGISYQIDCLELFLVVALIIGLPVFFIGTAFLTGVSLDLPKTKRNHSSYRKVQTSYKPIVKDNSSNENVGSTVIKPTVENTQMKAGLGVPASEIPIVSTHQKNTTVQTTGASSIRFNAPVTLSPEKKQTNSSAISKSVSSSEPLPSSQNNIIPEPRTRATYIRINLPAKNKATVKQQEQENEISHVCRDYDTRFYKRDILTVYDPSLNLEPIPPGPDNPIEGQYVFAWYQWEENTPEHKRARVNNHVIEYDALDNSYTVDKVKTASIEQLAASFGKKNPYSPKSSVPGHNYGYNFVYNAKEKNLLLKAIEKYEAEGVLNESQELANYIKVRKERSLSLATTQTGLLVAWFDGAFPICAGSVDLVLRNSQKTYGIVKIKNDSFSYDNHREEIALTLNLYRLCLEQCSGVSVSSLNCFHINKYSGICHVPRINETKARAALERDVQNYRSKYAEWKKIQFDRGPVYKVGQEVIYSRGYWGYVKVTAVDNENGFVEVQRQDIGSKTRVSQDEIRYRNTLHHYC